MDPTSSSSAAVAELVSRRTAVIAGHLRQQSSSSSAAGLLEPSACLHYSPPELSEPRPAFDTAALRRVMDGHDLEARDWLYQLIEESPLFCPRRRGGAGGRVFVAADYNQTKEQQRAMTMRRIEFLLGRGVFEGWLTATDPEAEMKKLAFYEVLGIYDHSVPIKLGVHFFLCSDLRIGNFD